MRQFHALRPLQSLDRSKSRQGYRSRRLLLSLEAEMGDRPHLPVFFLLAMCVKAAVAGEVRV